MKNNFFQIVYRVVDAKGRQTTETQCRSAAFRAMEDGGAVFKVFCIGIKLDKTLGLYLELTKSLMAR
ncbi:MAG: hypothetical protein IJE97_14510 [Thermoguttaceae bacterium]|nr:hypothetical protein [Thermoguttaceae bacterium]MBQ7110252.1 hypothetical protein [Thermoguttaceae bacterium]